MIVEHPDNPTIAATLADAGVYSLGGLLPGRAHIIARGEGLAPRATTVALEANVTTAVHDLELEAAGSVDGVVVDALGQPVANARIEVGYPGHVRHRSSLQNLLGGRPLTSTDGRFRIEGVIPGLPMRVQAATESSHSQTVSITLEPGQTRDSVELTLP